MPAEFDRCIRNGGRIRTETLSGGRYRKVCYLKGKQYKGHIQKKKGK